MKNICITPLSSHPPALKGTMVTLAHLGVSDMTVTEDGKIVGHAANVSYVKFACERQGYAKSVEELTTSP